MDLLTVNAAQTTVPLEYNLMYALVLIARVLSERETRSEWDCAKKISAAVDCWWYYLDFLFYQYTRGSEDIQGQVKFVSMIF